MSLDVKTELGRIFTVKDDDPDELKAVKQRGYVFSDVGADERKVVFLGINPSFLQEDKEESFSFKIENTGQHPYFKKYHNLAEQAGIQASQWAYLDMLCYRETDQNRFHQLISSPQGLKFVVEQLVLMHEQLNRLNPKLLVITNSLAATLFGINKQQLKDGSWEHVWLGYEFTDSYDEWGTYPITGMHKHAIHAIDSNLIGARAVFSSYIGYTMGKWNYERLEWQLKLVVEKLGILR